MKRTQIYLTEEQERAISRVASARRCSKAEVIRQVLDAAFDTGDAEADARAIIAGTAGLCADYPDWLEWLASVRGRTADERLTELGL